MSGDCGGAIECDYFADRGSSKRTRRGESESTRSVIACQALGIVLQYLLMPNIGWSIEFFENELPPLRIEIVKRLQARLDCNTQKNSEIQSRLSNEWAYFDMDGLNETRGYLLDDLMNSSNKLRSLIDTAFMRCASYSEGITEVDGKQYYPQHCLNEIVAILADSYFTPYSMMREHQAITLLISLREAYLTMHKALHTVLLSQQHRWSSKTSLIVYQLHAHSLWMNGFGLSLEHTLFSFAMTPFCIEKEREVTIPHIFTRVYAGKGIYSKNVVNRIFSRTLMTHITSVLKVMAESLYEEYILGGKVSAAKSVYHWFMDCFQLITYQFNLMSQHVQSAPNTPTTRYTLYKLSKELHHNLKRFKVRLCDDVIDNILSNRQSCTLSTRDLHSSTYSDSYLKVLDNEIRSDTCDSIRLVHSLAHDASRLFTIPIISNDSDYRSFSALYDKLMVNAYVPLEKMLGVYYQWEGLDVPMIVQLGMQLSQQTLAMRNRVLLDTAHALGHNKGSTILSMTRCVIGRYFIDFIARYADTFRNTWSNVTVDWYANIFQTAFHLHDSLSRYIEHDVAMRRETTRKQKELLENESDIAKEVHKLLYPRDRPNAELASTVCATRYLPPLLRRNGKYESSIDDGMLQLYARAIVLLSDKGFPNEDTHQLVRDCFDHAFAALQQARHIAALHKANSDFDKRDVKRLLVHELAASNFEILATKVVSTFAHPLRHKPPKASLEDINSQYERCIQALNQAKELYQHVDSCFKSPLLSSDANDAAVYMSDEDSYALNTLTMDQDIGILEILCSIGFSTIFTDKKEVLDDATLLVRMRECVTDGFAYFDIDKAQLIYHDVVWAIVRHLKAALSLANTHSYSKQHKGSRSYWILYSQLLEWTKLCVHIHITDSVDLKRFRKHCLMLDLDDNCELSFSIETEYHFGEDDEESIHGDAILFKLFIAILSDQTVVSNIWEQSLSNEFTALVDKLKQFEGAMELHFIDVAGEFYDDIDTMLEREFDEIDTLIPRIESIRNVSNVYKLFFPSNK